MFGRAVLAMRSQTRTCGSADTARGGGSSRSRPSAACRTPRRIILPPPAGPGVDIRQSVGATDSLTGRRGWVFGIVNNSQSLVTDPAITVDSGWSPSMFPGLMAPLEAACPSSVTRRGRAFPYTWTDASLPPESGDNCWRPYPSRSDHSHRSNTGPVHRASRRGIAPPRRASGPDRTRALRRGGLCCADPVRATLIKTRRVRTRPRGPVPGPGPGSRRPVRCAY